MAAKATRADFAMQRKIGREWREFRQEFLFTQTMLAEALGISRRAVQIVESGKSNKPSWPGLPQTTTRLKFKALKAKYKGEAAS
jgi:DNA-binding XRE family transcriptional regulator